MIRNIFFCVCMLLSTVLSFAQKNDKELFNDAVKDYNEGKYQSAVDTYTEILKKGKVSTALYYNLANANYKLNNVGASIYYYEKALQLSPDDSDVKNNLAFAKQMTIDAITPLPRTFFQRIHDKVTGMYHTDTWGWIAIFSMIFFTLCFLLYFFSKTTVRKRLFFTLCCISFMTAVATLGIAYYKIKDTKTNNHAVLFDKVVHVYSEPNPYSQEAFQLHEGTKVQVLEVFGEWNKIRLADGKIGWAKTSTMKML